MNAPLYQGLKQYSQTQYPFHMPGHKFGSFGDLSEINLCQIDATEAKGLDNLYEAEGIIEKAMVLMSSTYQSQDTLFLTNGSTAGILASILASCKPGDQLLVARNCHHSVWSALVLGGVVPIYISPSYREVEGVIGEIQVETIEEAIEKYPDVKGAIIVSPTYEGITSDIQGIANKLHEKNKLLIVDEAHGAHFFVDECFPKGSLEYGADLVIHSMHKTLPTLTQSALIHIGSERVKKEQIVSALKMVQTSSPSYAMMGLMDYVREYIGNHKKQIREEYIDPLQEIRKELRKLKYLRLLDEDMSRYDIGKIIILTNEANIDGYELARRLEEEYNLGVEAAHANLVILMTTVADKKEKLVQLQQALMQIDETLESGTVSIQAYKYIKEPPIMGNTPRDIYYKDKEWILLKDALGKVCANNIMLYPPGIPLVCIGEEIKEKHLQMIELIKEYLLGIQLEHEEIRLQISL